MALLPQPKNTTVAAIAAHYEKVAKREPRPHLGASIIGKECGRALWYDFRWATRVKFASRMLRLFETGNREENRMIVDLRNAGVKVVEKDPASGKQIEFKDIGGHFSGSLDAAGQGFVEAPKAWHVIELKTHNAKSFAVLTDKGVKEAKPLHWHQMNTYEGWSTMDRAFYMAHNKDTDDLYTERCEFDRVAFERDREKAKRVIEAPRPLTKINDKPDWHECRFCDHHPICHVGQAPAMSCRTCVHATPVVDDSTAGRWRCDRYNTDLTKEQQLAGCDSHLFIPELLPYGEVQDAGEEWITYKNTRNGKMFANCTPVGMPAITKDGPISIYTSDELHGLHPNLVGDSRVDQFVNEFDGKVVPTEQPPKETVE